MKEMSQIPSSTSPRPSSWRPFALNLICLPFSRPGRHGDGKRGQRFVAKRAELEAGAHRDGKANAGINRHHFLLIPQLAPHPAATAQEIPYFFHGVVGYGHRCLAGGQLEMGHIAATESQQYSNV